MITLSVLLSGMKCNPQKEHFLIQNLVLDGKVKTMCDKMKRKNAMNEIMEERFENACSYAIFIDNAGKGPFTSEYPMNCRPCKLVELYDECAVCVGFGGDSDGEIYNLSDPEFWEMDDETVYMRDGDLYIIAYENE